MQKFYPDTVHRLMHGEVTRLQTPQHLRDAPYPLVRQQPQLQPPPPERPATVGQPEEATVGAVAGERSEWLDYGPALATRRGLMPIPV